MGPADTLASMILGLIGIIFAIVAIIAIPVAIVEAFERIRSLWARGTWLTRAIFFFIPTLPIIIALILATFMWGNTIICVMVALMFDFIYFAILKDDLIGIRELMDGNPRFFNDALRNDELGYILRRTDKVQAKYDKELERLGRVKPVKKRVGVIDSLYEVAVWIAESRKISLADLQDHFSIDEKNASDYAGKLLELGIIAEEGKFMVSLMTVEGVERLYNQGKI